MSGTAFESLDDYIALPRVSDLAVSADGLRIVTTVSELHANRTEYTSAIWELDPTGEAPARRITHGAKGESSPTFTADGDLLFTACRPAGDDDDGDKSASSSSMASSNTALWRLPAAGGEAELVVELPGGVTAVRSATTASTLAVVGPMLPSATSLEDDRRLRTLRDDGEVSAILHSGYPIRYWDKDLGPDENHVFRVSFGVDGEGGEGGTPIDVTASPGIGLRDADVSLSSDGTFAVAAWRIPQSGPSVRVVLVRIDFRSGERAVIVDDPQADFEHPVISPDGSAVAFTRETFSTPHRAPRISLCYLRFDSNTVIDLASQWERWPLSVAWTPDGDALLVTADQDGRCPIFRVALDGSVAQLTQDDFSYTNVIGAPDGTIYALRSSYGAPPHPVRINSGIFTPLRCVDLPKLPGELTEVAVDTADGTRVRSWLVLPDSPQPAPLLLWVHGGPLNSWNAWSWRWNPWLMAAHGYAVLLPDPALSTGYGQDFIQRGWGSWGSAPYEDLMAVVDGACDHARIDSSRIGLMGGSFGGYMANWIAGHTDRFQAIVTHASIWALDQFGATTDNAYYWVREMTPAMAQENSPHRSVEHINTPMLVVHGDKDYRVPIGEGLRLWYDLLNKSKLAADADGRSPHRFLYFPDENHWVLAPQHAKIWYQVVTAFLAEHVLGESVPLPEELG